MHIPVFLCIGTIEYQNVNNDPTDTLLPRKELPSRAGDEPAATPLAPASPEPTISGELLHVLYARSQVYGQNEIQPTDIHPQETRSVTPFDDSNYIKIFYIQFRVLQIAFSSVTLHVRVALKL